MESGQFLANFFMVSPANGINLEIFYANGPLMTPVKLLTGTRAQASGTMGFSISGQFDVGFYVFSIDVANNNIENPSWTFRWIPSDSVINQQTVLNQNLNTLLDVQVSAI